jgi:hypothetical protein
MATKSRFFKEDEEGVRKMCKAMEDMRKEAKKEEAIRFANSLLDDKMSIEFVAKHSGLPVVFIENLVKQRKVKGLPN